MLAFTIFVGITQENIVSIGVGDIRSGDGIFKGIEVDGDEVNVVPAEVEEFVVHPNTIRNLAQGQAVVLVKQPSAARLMDVVAHDRVVTDGWPRYTAPRRDQSPVGLDLPRRAQEERSAAHDAKRALMPKTRAERAELKQRLLAEMKADDDPEEKPD